MNIRRTLTRDESLVACIHELIDEIKCLNPSATNNPRVEMALKVVNGGLLQTQLVVAENIEMTEVNPEDIGGLPAVTHLSESKILDLDHVSTEASMVYGFFSKHVGTPLTAAQIIESLADQGVKRRRGKGALPRSMVEQAINELRDAGANITTKRGFPGYTLNK